jgi:hypothetical protein
LQFILSFNCLKTFSRLKKNYKIILEKQAKNKKKFPKPNFSAVFFHDFRAQLDLSSVANSFPFGKFEKLFSYLLK